MTDSLIDKLQNLKIRYRNHTILPPEILDYVTDIIRQHQAELVARLEALKTMGELTDYGAVRNQGIDKAIAIARGGE